MRFSIILKLLNCKSTYIRSRKCRDRFAITLSFWPYGDVERDTLHKSIVRQ